MERMDQCVASVGVVWSVRSIMAATSSSLMLRGLPERGSSRSPSIRFARNLRRHLLTVCSSTPSSAATTLFCSPSAQRSTIRHLSDRDRATLRRRTCRSRYPRSSALKTRAAIGRPLAFSFAIRTSRSNDRIEGNELQFQVTRSRPHVQGVTYALVAATGARGWTLGCVLINAVA